MTIPKTDPDRYARVLGLPPYEVTADYVCFLPWLGEFGWYVLNHVKRVEGFNHPNKIVCVKPGHECLFPSAKHFFYDWVDDVPDRIKAGPIASTKEDELQEKIRRIYSNHSVQFVSPKETSWDEKFSLSHFNPVPVNRHDHNLRDIDVVITPRKRVLEPERNYTRWQEVVDQLVQAGRPVGICGSKETSYDLQNVKYKSWDYIDVDTDVELMRNAKIILSLETGLLYLAKLLKKPIVVVGHYHWVWACMHRDKNQFFKNITSGNPDEIVHTVLKYLHENNL
jgi:hypothetical protein